MKYSTTHEFIAAVRHAPYLPKIDFVKSRVVGRKVLDLGCVQHSLVRLFQEPDRWMHNIIRANAASVLGIDILEKEVTELNQMGYDMVVADATRIRLEEKFDVVVCGDIIEHLVNPGDLLETVAFHLNPGGVGLLTTPNPFAANRFFNILFDGSTGVNPEHTCWFCPHTLYLLAKRCGLYVKDFCWLETAFQSPTQNRLWGRMANLAGKMLMRRNQMMRLDFGAVLAKEAFAERPS